MADYGVRYIIAGTSRMIDPDEDERRYVVKILFKDYLGPFNALTGAVNFFTLKASGDDDDPLTTTIKATSSTVSYINEGSAPIDVFPSNDDTFCKCEFYTESGALIWAGFLSQDDISELWIDYNHEVALTFTDGLGFLNNIAFDRSLDIEMPDTFPLLTCIGYCLYATGLRFDVETFLNIYEDTMVARGADPVADALLQTIIYTNTFINDDDTYKSCYEVLDYIGRTFNLRFCQYLGTWSVLRIPELRQAAAARPLGTHYTPAGIATQVQLGPAINAGRNQDLEPINVGTARSFKRAWQYDKETFNYRQPRDIIKNAALNKLGALISSTIAGTTKKDVYAFPASSQWSHRIGDASVIVVETDTISNKEIDRYVRQPLIDQPSGAGPFPSYEFNEIYVSSGDKFEFNFSWRSETEDDSGAIAFITIINLITGNNEYYRLTGVNTAGTTVFGWNKFNVAETPAQGNRLQAVYITANNVADWQTYTLSQLIPDPHFIPPFPKDGKLHIYIAGFNTNQGVNRVTNAKGFNLEIKHLINGSYEVIGQVHNTSQPGDLIKNNQDEEIFFDDSPKYDIAGTLFTNALSDGWYITKTKSWHRLTEAGGKTLGKIIQGDKMQMRGITREVIQGVFKNLMPNDEPLHMLHVIQFPDLRPGYYYVIGVASLNYGQNTAELTLHEISRPGEAGLLPALNYTFTYLYANS